MDSDRRSRRQTQYTGLVPRGREEEKNFLSILLNTSIGFVSIVTFHDNHDNQENATYTSGYHNSHDVVLSPGRFQIRGLVFCKIAVSVSERKMDP